MSKCNLLRPIGSGNGSATYDGGTFYLFSQYADDLTRQNAQGDAYRVVPSKFAAFNIDYSGKTNAGVGEVFQNYFEHACSMFRHKMANDNETDPELFTPEHSANLFWQAMGKLGVSCPTSGDCPGSLVWIGESEVCGTTVIDGDAFSEIYCYIPGSAHARVYEASSIDIPTQIDPDQMSCIYGWTSSTYPTNTGLSSSVPGDALSLVTTGCPQHLKPEWHEYPGDLLQSHGDLIDSTIQNTGWTDAQSQDNYFKINTVAVFYDIVAKDEEGNYHSIYENIPLGIYFTGPIEGSTLKNEVKKYISHDDIYGQGTAYGLRITTKFSAHPCLNTSCEDHAHAEVVYAGHSYAEAAAVIDSMRAAGDAVLAAVSQNSAFNTELMNHLSQFRNKNTNIPYIRTVGGDDYWFVNGRNTGRRVDGTEATADEIKDMVMDEISDILDNLLPEDQTGDGKAYIEYIVAKKYQNDTSITEIPEIEDFQDLNGKEDDRNPAGMFQGCSSLTCVPKLEVSNATNMSNMFKGCSSITSVDLSGSWQCTTFSHAFDGCRSLVSVKIDAMSCTNFTDTFRSCTNLKNVLIDNILPGTQSSPRVIDLSGTQVNLWSLKRMIQNVQDQKINTNPGNGSQANGFVTLKVPSSAASFDLDNEVFLALNNKGVKFTIQ